MYKTKKHTKKLNITKHNKLNNNKFKSNTKKQSNSNNNTILNKKEHLTISKLKHIYNDVLNEKNIKYNGLRTPMITFILNFYLLLKGYRNIFQIEYRSDKTLKLIENIFLNKYDITYKLKRKLLSLHSYKRIIVYNSNKFNINNLNNSLDKDFAKQLGEFYVCAGEIGLLNRIVIQIKKDTDNNNGKDNNKDIKQFFTKLFADFNIVLYSQMCNNISINDKNIDKLKSIAKDISMILQKFDKDLITELTIIKNGINGGIKHKFSYN